MKKNSLELPIIEELYQLTHEDFTPARIMLGNAFRKDPIWSEIMKNREDKFPIIFGVPLKYSLKYGKIYAPTSDIEATALWLGTPFVDMNIWRVIRSGSITMSMKLGSKIAKLMMKVFDQIAKDRKNFMKGEYVYLIALGVSPEKQGQGLGSHLVRTMQNNLPPKVPIYLETESERNVRFYEQLGFEVINKLQVPIFDLPMWEMIYQP